jgi:hypothetical protein
MKTYVVRARRRQGGWDLEIDGIGVTRADRLTSAERRVRAHLDLLGHSDATTAAVSFEYAKDVEREIEAVRASRTAADAANRTAAERTRVLARRLVDEKYSGAEVALMLGVTPQRVSQLVASTRPQPPRAAPLSAPTPAPVPQKDRTPKAGKKKKKSKAK